MVNPQLVLSETDYRNYRSVRVVAKLFLFFGGIFVLSAVSLRGNPGLTQAGKNYLVLSACFGATSVIGGIGTLRGGRRWAPLIRVLAIFYFFGFFPIGTILGYIIFTRLSGYLDSVERIKAQDAEPAVARPENQ